MKADERTLLDGWLGASGGPRHADAAFFDEAAARYQEGRAAEAEAAVDAYLSKKPASAAGQAVKAVLAAARGDAPAVLEWSARAAGGGAPWARALRGVLLSRLGLLDEARAELEAAGEGAPAWALSERASVRNKLGFFWLALEDLDRLRRLLPESPEADLRAAEIHADQAQYAAARARLARALKRAPGDPGILRRRAQLSLVQGDAAGALPDLRAAAAAAPGDVELAAELCRALAVAGRYAEAERAARVLPEPRRLYARAYALCRRERFAQSSALFARAARGLSGPLAERASFYALVARTLGQADPPLPLPGKPPREMRIMGLGYRQPFQVSREVLASMRTCDVLYSNLSDAAVADFLGLFRAPFRAIVFRRSDQDAFKCARDVMPAFKTRRKVGIVTRGHPLYYGRLAYRVTTLCRRKGFGVRVFGSISVADTIGQLVDHARGTALGVQIRETRDIEGLDPRLPLVLYNFAAEGRWREELAERLAAGHPARHPVWLLAGSGDREFTPLEAPVEGLAEALRSADEAVTLLVGAPEGER